LSFFLNKSFSKKLHHLFRTIKKYDVSEAAASRDLGAYGEVTHGGNEIFDQTGLKITHANFNRMFRLICANTSETKDGVSQDQILKEMEKTLESVPTFIAKIVENYYQ
jgi:hypothetical protein